MEITFREIKSTDLKFVRDIFNYYIINTTKNYRTVPLTMSDLKEIICPGHQKYKSYLVAENSIPCGFCYLSQFRKRQAYDRTAEITLYLKEDFTGKGIGSHIMQFMEGVARNAGIKVLVGIISGENKESITLFKKHNYWQCAHYQKVAEKFGKVMDVVVYQKIIDT
jgi:L-amino acid N-acyltransferase YncA